LLSVVDRILVRCDRIGDHIKTERETVMSENTSKIRRAEAPVKVEVGAGATPPKVSQQRSDSAPVKVQTGAGAAPAKISLQRSEKPVKVQVGAGAAPAKVSRQR
jgi:hypothetical protein